MEDADVRALPGWKLDLGTAGNVDLMSNEDKEIYASGAGSGI